MKKRPLILLFLILILCLSRLPAEKYELYGYSDFMFYSGSKDWSKDNHFTRNRTNILLASEISKKWDFFLNIEFNGALKLGENNDRLKGETETNLRGSIELEEAWTSFTVSEKIKLKAGIFHAPFGSFNVIQDASPTYISVRPPMIYDDAFRGWRPVSIIPDKANLEISGRLQSKRLTLEYSLYAGSMRAGTPENLNINSDISVGSRLKFSLYENLNIGVSAYFDNAYVGSPFHRETSMEKRSLYSIDMDYSLGKLNINGEYFFNKNNNQKLGEYNRSFCYINLNFEIIEKLRIYGEIDSYKDNIPDTTVIDFLGRGINKAISGLNFKPNWKTAIKAEIQHYYFPGNSWNPHTVFVTSLSVIF